MTTQNLSRQQTRTRLALMNAAIQLILDNGYDNLTVVGITNHADYGKGVFYVYFQNKEDILYHIVTNWVENMTTNIFKRVKHYPSPEREYHVFRSIAQSFVANHSFFRQMRGGFKGQVQEQVKAFAVEDVKKHIALGNLTLQANVSLDMAAQLHISMMADFLKLLGQNYNGTNLDEMVDNFYRLSFNQEPPKLQ